MSGTGHFFLNSHEMPTISSRNNSQSNSLDEKNKERGEETVNENDDEDYKPRSTFGILRVKETDSVPGMQDRSPFITSREANYAQGLSCYCPELLEGMHHLACDMLPRHDLPLLCLPNLLDQCGVAAHSGALALPLLRRSARLMGKSYWIRNLMTQRMIP